MTRNEERNLAALNAALALGTDIELPSGTEVKLVGWLYSRIDATTTIVSSNTDNLGVYYIQYLYHELPRVISVHKDNILCVVKLPPKVDWRTLPRWKNEY